MTYGFKERFADALLMDTKLSTIRAPRKDGRLPEPGEVIRRYTGMRTKNCRWRGDRVCKSVTWIAISKAGNVWLESQTALSVTKRERLAQRDGFKNWAEMFEFFSTVHSLPFHGWLIEWHPYAKP